jgi:hypothetical protein
LHQEVQSSLASLWVRGGGANTATTFLVQTTFGTGALYDSLHMDYGAPAVVWTTIEVPARAGLIQINVSYYNKTATRLPESIFWRAAPSFNYLNSGPAPAQWCEDVVYIFLSSIYLISGMS